MKKLLLFYFAPFILINNSNAQAPSNTCATIAYDIPIGGCTGPQGINDITAEGSSPAISCGITSSFESEGWYSFTIPSGPNQNITVTATSVYGSTDLIIQILSGTCIEETEIGCANNVTPTSPQTETATIANLTPGIYFIRIVNVNGTAIMGLSNVCVNSSTVGITETVNEKAFSIFPNPFISQTTITFEKEMKNVTINVTDALGKQIKTVTFSGKQLIIERAEMSRGIYFVEALDKKEIVGKKKMVVQ